MWRLEKGNVISHNGELTLLIFELRFLTVSLPSALAGQLNRIEVDEDRFEAEKIVIRELFTLESSTSRSRSTR